MLRRVPVFVLSVGFGACTPPSPSPSPSPSPTPTATATAPSPPLARPTASVAPESPAAAAPVASERPAVAEPVAEAPCTGVDAADAAASPRADEQAELLALVLDRTIVATSATYARVHRDLAAIRAAKPQLRDVTVLAGDVHQLETSLYGHKSLLEMCPLPLLGPGSLEVQHEAGSPDVTYQRVTLRARTNLRLVGDALKRLPNAGVESSYARVPGVPAWRTPEHGKLCGHRDAERAGAIVYIFDHAREAVWHQHVDGTECASLCRIHHAVALRTDVAGAVVRVGEWRAESGPAPDWYPQTLVELRRWCTVGE